MFHEQIGIDRFHLFENLARILHPPLTVYMQGGDYRFTYLKVKLQWNGTAIFRHNFF